MSEKELENIEEWKKDESRSENEEKFKKKKDCMKGGGTRTRANFSIK